MPMALPVLITVLVPQLQFIDKFVDIPVVVVQRQGPMVLSVQKPVEIAQVPQLRADGPDYAENC